MNDVKVIYIGITLYFMHVRKMTLKILKQYWTQNLDQLQNVYKNANAKLINKKSESQYF